MKMARRSQPRTTFAWIGDDEDDVMPFSSPEDMAVSSAPVA